MMPSKNQAMTVALTLAVLIVLNNVKALKPVAELVTGEKSIF